MIIVSPTVLDLFASLSTENIDSVKREYTSTKLSDTEISNIELSECLINMMRMSGIYLKTSFIKELDKASYMKMSGLKYFTYDGEVNDYHLNSDGIEFRMFLLERATKFSTCTELINLLVLYSSTGSRVVRVAGEIGN